MDSKATIEFEDGKIVVKEITRVAVSKDEVLAVRVPDETTDSQLGRLSRSLQQVFKGMRVVAYKGEFQFTAISQEDADEVEYKTAESKRLQNVAIVTQRHLWNTSDLEFKVEYNERVEILHVSLVETLGRSGTKVAEILRRKIAEAWGVAEDSFGMEIKNVDPGSLPR